MIWCQDFSRDLVLVNVTGNSNQNSGFFVPATPQIASDSTCLSSIFEYYNCSTDCQSCSGDVCTTGTLEATACYCYCTGDEQYLCPVSPSASSSPSPSHSASPSSSTSSTYEINQPASPSPTEVVQDSNTDPSDSLLWLAVVAVGVALLVCLFGIAVVIYVLKKKFRAYYEKNKEKYTQEELEDVFHVDPAEELFVLDNSE